MTWQVLTTKPELRDRTRNKTN